MTGPDDRDPLPSPEGRRVLVCDDEAPIRRFLAESLESFGFVVTAVGSGPEAVERARTARPDLVVLDVMMPRMDGFETLRKLRDDGCRAPVVFLTARDGVRDRVTGLDLGADDYLVKPFSVAELVTRLRVLLRSHGGATPLAPPSRLTVADLVVDDASHEVTRAGRAVTLTPTEFAVLRYLVANAGVVLSKPRIIEAVWGGEPVEATVVETYVSALRRKLDAGGPDGARAPRLVHTVRGVGYVLRAPR